jgi:hypothetical protein
MNPAEMGTYVQLLLMGGSGAGAGYYISTKIGPTELPQVRKKPFSAFKRITPEPAMITERFMFRQSQLFTR